MKNRFGKMVFSGRKYNKLLKVAVGKYLFIFGSLQRRRVVGSGQDNSGLELNQT